MRQTNSATDEQRNDEQRNDEQCGRKTVKDDAR
jgi:hypothetical protein